MNPDDECRTCPQKDDKCGGKAKSLRARYKNCLQCSRTGMDTVECVRRMRNAYLCMFDEHEKYHSRALVFEQTYIDSLKARVMMIIYSEPSKDIKSMKSLIQSQLKTQHLDRVLIGKQQLEKVYHMYKPEQVRAIDSTDKRIKNIQAFFDWLKQVPEIRETDLNYRKAHKREKKKYAALRTQLKTQLLELNDRNTVLTIIRDICRSNERVYSTIDRTPLDLYSHSNIFVDAQLHINQEFVNDLLRQMFGADSNSHFLFTNNKSWIYSPFTKYKRQSYQKTNTAERIYTPCVACPQTNDSRCGGVNATIAQQYQNCLLCKSDMTVFDYATRMRAAFFCLLDQHESYHLHVMMLEKTYMSMLFSRAKTMRLGNVSSESLKKTLAPELEALNTGKKRLIKSLQHYAPEQVQAIDYTRQRIANIDDFLDISMNTLLNRGVHQLYVVRDDDDDDNETQQQQSNTQTWYQNILTLFTTEETYLDDKAYYRQQKETSDKWYDVFVTRLLQVVDRASNVEAVLDILIRNEELYTSFTTPLKAYSSTNLHIDTKPAISPNIVNRILNRKDEYDFVQSTY